MVIEPNPDYVTVRAKRKLEVRVEFEGGEQFINVLVDGESTQGTHVIGGGPSGFIEAALEHFRAIYKQSL